MENFDKKMTAALDTMTASICQDYFLDQRQASTLFSNPATQLSYFPNMTVENYFIYLC